MSMKKNHFLIILTCSILIAFLNHSKLLESLELKSIDLRFQLRYGDPDSSNFSDKIVIIGIDDQSIQRIPEPFILWDTFFAEIIEKLGQYQAELIGIDVIWAKSIDQFLKRPAKDKNALRKAMLKTIKKYHVPIVIGVAGNNQDTNKETKSDLMNFKKTFDSSLPMKQFGIIVGSKNFGILNTFPDLDKHVRRVRHEFKSATSEQKIPGFANLIASKSTNTVIAPPKQLQLINYHLDKQFPVLSFEQVLQKSRQDDQAYFAKYFKDKIVLIAVNNVSDDIHATPLGKEISGIFIHAHSIDNYLNQDYLNELPSDYIYLLIIFLSLITGILSARLRLYKAGIFILVLGLGYFSLALLSFSLNYVIPLFAPLLTILVTFSCTFIYRYTIEDKNKRRLAESFSSYVNEQVVEEILNSDQPIPLEGSQNKIAILFSDIRGFTTYSETHPPTTVVKILNEYFAAMTEEIWEQRGTVDKFIGDGMMVFFGAPTSVENPTLRALKAAQGMRHRLQELNEKWQQEGYDPIDNGIGIHTGEAIVGNIGSEKKRDYTAIGDAVNIASRIEGLTKSLDTPILMSADSMESVKEYVQVKSQGMVPIKGHTDIEVFELINFNGG